MKRSMNESALSSFNSDALKECGDSENQCVSIKVLHMCIVYIYRYNIISVLPRKLTSKQNQKFFEHQASRILLLLKK